MTNLLLSLVLVLISFYGVTSSGIKNNDSLNLRIAKFVDFQVGGDNLKNWSLENLFKSQLSDILEKQPETSESTSKKQLNDEITQVDLEIPDVRVERDSESNAKSIANRLDDVSKRLQSIQNVCEKSTCEGDKPVIHGNDGINYTELCKRNIGVSKPQICELYENDDITKNPIPKNCKEIQEKGENKSGMYLILPKSGLKPIWVLCDMETKDGGWTVIQKRFDGSENFFREWRDYKFGFGNLKKEFWIGLESIYHITGFEVNELLVELTDRDKVKAYAHYKAFGIGPETDGYTLNVLRGFSGDAGDSLTPHLGSKFSTKDMDQDAYAQNCAEIYLGGWWYKACHVSNLNGKYINMQLPEAYKFKGLHWLGYRGHEYCHAGSRMLVRPAQP